MGDFGHLLGHVLMLLLLSYTPALSTYASVMGGRYASKKSPAAKVGNGGDGREGRVVSTRAFGGGNGWERRKQKIPSGGTKVGTV